MKKKQRQDGEDGWEQQAFAAAGSGDVSWFESLAEDDKLKSCLVSTRDDDGRSIVHVAAAAGHAGVVDKVVRLIHSVQRDSEGGASLGHPPAASASVVSEPASASRLEPVHATVTALVNSADEEGWTALHSAASTGHTTAAARLLSYGANANAVNSGGRTPLHYAASKGHSQVLRLLLANGADIRHKDKVGCTPLHRAASAGHASACEALLEEGAAVDAVDRMGQTALMMAAQCAHEKVCLLLLQKGATVSAKDREGETALSLAANSELQRKLTDAARAAHPADMDVC